MKKRKRLINLNARWLRRGTGWGADDRERWSPAALRVCWTA